MLDRNEALALVLKGCSANFEANDFKVKKRPKFGRFLLLIL